MGGFRIITFIQSIWVVPQSTSHRYFFKALAWANASLELFS